MIRFSLLSCLFLSFASLPAASRQPWLGNLYELEASLVQNHTRSSQIDTARGREHKSLHSDLTMMKLSVVPLLDTSAEVELDLARTQSHHFGFDAFKAAVRHAWLNDLAGDIVSVGTGMSASVSTSSRVADLSSHNHGVTELEMNSAIGKEFGYSDSGFYRVWAAGFVGIANKGSPWIGVECQFEKVIRDCHFIALFFQAEKGTSSNKLCAHFHRWASVGYEFQEIGARYSFKEYSLGTVYAQVVKRIHARYCPDNSWSIQVGVMVPFSVL